MSTAGGIDVQRLRALHRAPGRREQGRFLAEGRRAISAFLDAGWVPLGLYVQDAAEIPPEWPAGAVVVAERTLARISQATTPSGLVAEFALPLPAPLRREAGGLILAGVADPGNVGTLLRSAAAFGLSQVLVLGDGCDPWAHKVVQASAGALAKVSLHRCDALPALLAPLVALCAEGGSPPSAFSPGPAWLLVGSEAHGVTLDLLARADHRLHLPMPGGTESLNAAVAGSIAAFLLAGLHR